MRNLLRSHICEVPTAQLVQVAVSSTPQPGLNLEAANHGRVELEAQTCWRASAATEQLGSLRGECAAPEHRAWVAKLSTALNGCKKDGISAR